MKSPVFKIFIHFAIFILQNIFILALLHMVLISGALSVSIYSFSTSADLQVCIPSDSPQGDLFMLWVPSVYNGPINHVVPLMERQICPQVDGHCTLGRFCSFDGNGAEGEKVRCSLCERPYHSRCAFLDRPPTWGIP